MATVDVIRDLIGGGLVAYNRPVAARFGVNAAILMHELAYWCNRADDGWCYRTQEEIQETTGLRVEGQNGARKVLKECGVLSERREGIPARIYYSIDWDVFVQVLSDPEQDTVKTGTGNGKDRNKKPESPEHIYKASNSKQVEEQVSVKDGGPKPFDMLEALGTVVGVDMATLPGATKGKQCKVAERLIATGFTVQDVTRCAQWLQSQTWRTSGFDLFTIEKERGKWEMAGKPGAIVEKAKEAKRSAEETNNEAWAEMAAERGLKPNRAEREGRIQVDDAYEAQYHYAE